MIESREYVDPDSNRQRCRNCIYRGSDVCKEAIIEYCMEGTGRFLFCDQYAG